MKKRFNIITVLLLICSILLLTACEENGEEIVERIEIKSLPTKTVYELNEEIELAGGKITVYIKDADSKELDMTSSGVTHSELDKTKSGNQKIIITYREKSAQFDVTVNAAEEITVQSISVKTNPTKLTYFVNETLQLEGGVISVLKSNGETDEISMDDLNVEVACDLIASGIKTVTVSYQGKSTTFSITVSELTITSILVKTNPTKIVYYEDEALDLSGGVIEITYANASTGTISMKDENVLATGFDNTTPGTISVTLTYMDKTTPLSLTIKNSVTEAQVIKQLFDEIIQMETLTFEDYDKIQEAITQYNSLGEKAKAFISSEDYDVILGFKFTLLNAKGEEIYMSLYEFELMEDFSNIDELIDLYLTNVPVLIEIFDEFKTLKEYSNYPDEFNDELIDATKLILMQELELLELVKRCKDFLIKIENNPNNVSLEDKDIILEVFTKLFFEQSTEEESEILWILFYNYSSPIEYYDSYIKALTELAFAEKENLLLLVDEIGNLLTIGNVEEGMIAIASFLENYDALNGTDKALFDEYLQPIIELIKEVAEQYRYYENEYFIEFINLVNELQGSDDEESAQIIIGKIEDLFSEMPADLLEYFYDGYGVNYYNEYLSLLNYIENLEEINQLKILMEELYYGNLDDFKRLVENYENNLETYKSLYEALDDSRKYVSSYQNYEQNYLDMLQHYSFSDYVSMNELTIIKELLKNYPDIVSDKINGQMELYLSHYDDLLELYNAINDLPSEDRLSIEQHYDLIMDLIDKSYFELQTELDYFVDIIITNINVLLNARNYLDYLASIESFSEEVLAINQKVLALVAKYNEMSIDKLDDLKADLEELNSIHVVNPIVNYIWDIYYRHTNLYNEYERYQEIIVQINQFLSEEQLDLAYYLEVSTYRQSTHIKEDKIHHISNYNDLLALYEEAITYLTNHTMSLIDDLMVNYDFNKMEELVLVCGTNYNIKFHKGYYEQYMSLCEILIEDFNNKHTSFASIEDVLAMISYFENEETMECFVHNVLRDYYNLISEIATLFNEEIVPNLMLPNIYEYEIGTDIEMEEHVLEIADVLKKCMNIFGHIDVWRYYDIVELSIRLELSVGIQ